MNISKKHIILCTIPLAGGALYLASGGSTNSLITFGIIAACPLMHLFMMHDNQNNDHKKEIDNKKGGDHHEA